MGAKRRILVVDDNQIFLEALGTTLEAMEYEPTLVSEVQGALHLLGLKGFDAVVSDIRLQGPSGLELLKVMNKDYSDIPVILMTGYSEILETLNAYEAGAKGFLAKPFKREDLKGVLDSIFEKDQEAADPQSLDDEYVGISIDEFLSGTQIQYEVFLRLSATKYIKIAHTGENLTPERIALFKSKGMGLLYLRRDDYARYVGFAMRIQQLAASSESLATAKKLGVMKFAGEAVLRGVIVEGLDQEKVAYTEQFVKSTLQTLSSHADISKLLHVLNQHADFLLGHSVAVSFYAVLVARQMGWNSAQTLFKVSMSGLLHDIGKKELPRELLEKPRIDLTPAEIVILETHPARGAEILAQIPSIPSDVIQVALEHHEDMIGLGYPRNLNKNQIHPLARLISVVDAFVKQIVKGPDLPQVRTPREAITNIHLTSSGRLDPQALAALEKLVERCP